MPKETALERAFREVDVDTVRGYVLHCVQTGEHPTPDGLLDYTGISIDSPSPEARAAALDVFRASIERRYGVRIVPTTDPSSPYRIVIPPSAGKA